nr:hypothetical protein [Actinophytocola algeriensis]
MYTFIRTASRPVTRDEAAAAVGISRKLAAFHPLAAKAPDVVCGINHAFLTGVVDGLAATSIRAVLDPGAGGCCVELSANPQPQQ